MKIPHSNLYLSGKSEKPHNRVIYSTSRKAYKAASLINEPLAADFSFENYKGLNRVLFEDLYDWAEQLRTIALSKTATVSTTPERIDELGGLIFARLEKVGLYHQTAP